MIILGIESSCDDTSVALVKADESGFEILAEKTASQIEVHKKYGGVVPEIAGRCHAENISPLVEDVLAGQPKPDAIAVTSGPGLITGLMVGVEAAKTLSYLLNVPIVSVNHIDGHIHSVEIFNFQFSIFNKIEYPALALVASGGHTELILMQKQSEYERVGATKDDATGECFDKVAKLLGFEYPGGPKISKFAAEGNPHAIQFPRPMLNSGDLNFSFAGLKTSALYWLRDNAKKQVTGHWSLVTGLKDFCASFEQAIIDVLVGKTLKAVKKYQPKTVILGGGVAANKKLRETLSNTIQQYTKISNIQYPISNYCMDNAAMIAVAGYYKALNKNFTKWDKLTADPNWKICD